MSAKPTIWNPDAWAEFKAQAPRLKFSGLKGDALWQRIEELRAPVFASAHKTDHAQVHEETMHLLAALGIVPAGWAPY